MSRNYTTEYDKWRTASLEELTPMANTEMEYNVLRKEAARRVQKKINFYKNLGSYVIVIGFLWMIAILTGSGAWPIFPMLGWGLGVVFQALDAFIFGSITENTRQNMIQEEMRRMRY